MSETVIFLIVIICYYKYVFRNGVLKKLKQRKSNWETWLLVIVNEIGFLVYGFTMLFALLWQQVTWPAIFLLAIGILFKKTTQDMKNL